MVLSSRLPEAREVEPSIPAATAAAAIRLPKWRELPDTTARLSDLARLHIRPGSVWF